MMLKMLPYCHAVSDVSLLSFLEGLVKVHEASGQLIVNNVILTMI